MGRSTGKVLGLATLLAALASSAVAADIYGRAWVAPSGAAATPGTVLANCGGGKYSVSVDQYGRYSIAGVPRKANCSLRVKYKGVATSNGIDVYTGAARNGANLELRRSGNRLLLIRR